MKAYEPADIEPKWQRIWAETNLYRTPDFDSRPKYYLLTEFPYPSGEGLHLGHAREYTLGDVMARHKRMQGYNVLYPMGSDAFGLPTENFAIKHKIAPQVATSNNIANFRKQFDALGYSFDWSREVNTSDPKYYKWTQWLFLQFFRAGLAYQAEIAINWCPKCKTGLANEEVVNGRHERCGTIVEKKLLKQWLLKITAYAERLIEGLKTVDYPHKIASQQINWIGRSEGAELEFRVASSESRVTVFTTRPDTLGGATFLVLAPEHPLVDQITSSMQRKVVQKYIREVQSESELERQNESRTKTGVWTGAIAKNPLNGAEIPVWIADYVLLGYGTGAIMAVPAHDERDFAFAQQFELPVVRVVEGGELPYSGDGHLINSGKYDGLSGADAKHAIIDSLSKAGQAKHAVKYKLRDWVFSRQHYWGEPIPIIHCSKCGTVPVPEDQLPLELPPVEHYEPTDNGESPLAAMADWVNVDCPKCGSPAKRETDTMPNWAGSSWYYLRYTDPTNDQAFADSEKLKYWGPVDMYLGSMEHTTLHLLYSRFWHQFLYDQKLVPTPEPYAARRGQGMVLATDGRKMSKSLGNVINPMEYITKLGADSLRLYVMFMAPYDDTTEWSDERLAGVNRFVYRAWAMAERLIANNSTMVIALPTGTTGSIEATVDRMTHKTIKKIHEDIEGMHFNTVVSALMEYVNFLNDPELRRTLAQPEYSDLAQRTVRSLVLLLAPSAPHLAEELWQQMGETESVHLEPWPKYDANLIKDEIVEIAIQVNGKLRGTMLASVEAGDDELKKAAAQVESVQKHLAEKTIVKTIVVPRKLVNFVVKP